MANTFKVRVEDYVGTFSDTTALDDWLTSAAKLLIDIIPPSRAQEYSQTAVDSGSGVAVPGRITGAHKSSRGAAQIPQELAAAVVDSASLILATAESPVYYVIAGTCFVKPGGGSVLYLGYPTVVNTDTTIANFPTQLIQAVVLYAAIQAAIQNYNVKVQTTLAALAWSAQTPPTPPSAPSFTYTPASATAIGLVTIPAFGTPPVFTPPTLSVVFTNANTYMNTDQDVELGLGELQKLKVAIEEYVARLQESVGEFNEDNAEYQTSVQRAIEQARLNNKYLTDEAQMATQVAIQNAAQALAEQVQEYAAMLGKFSAEINLYQANIQAEASRFSTTIQKVVAECEGVFRLTSTLKAEWREIIQLYIAPNTPVKEGANDR